MDGSLRSVESLRSGLVTGIRAYEKTMKNWPTMNVNLARFSITGQVPQTVGSVIMQTRHKALLIKIVSEGI